MHRIYRARGPPHKKACKCSVWRQTLTRRRTAFTGNGLSFASGIRLSSLKCTKRGHPMASRVLHRTPEAGTGAVNRWIALLDQAEHLRAIADPHSPMGLRQASRAIDSLFAYEHQLIPTSRRAAREKLWRRGHVGQDFPATYPDWHLCRCRQCLFERRHLRSLPTITKKESN